MRRGRKRTGRLGPPAARIERDRKHWQITRSLEQLSKTPSNRGKRKCPCARKTKNEKRMVAIEIRCTIRGRKEISTDFQGERELNSIGGLPFPCGGKEEAHAIQKKGGQIGL